jgi:hypothetical protein
MFTMRTFFPMKSTAIVSFRSKRGGQTHLGWALWVAAHPPGPTPSVGDDGPSPQKA